jgi:RND family efflux transporter MFP subunit
MKPISALALATLLVSGCGRKPETQATSHPDLAAVQVQVQTAESKQRATTEEVLGTVRAKLRAALEAKLSGRIDKMPVLLGQAVKAGQLVAHLDAAEIKARLEQAQASLQQAERDWKRSSALFDQQAATRSDYDTADSRYQVAKAAVAEAQAMMGYLEILVPFDGVVTKKWADVGDFATPGKPLIDIEDPSRLQLEADVPEAIASLIKQDAPLAVRVDSVKSDLTATVSEIAPSADPASRTFRVKLDLPQTPGLMSGQFARLVVPVGENTSVRVPASAVVMRGQMEILFVVANQRAQLHLVKTGKRLGDDVEILAGLDAGESVVVGGAALLVDGQPVEAK